MTRSRELSQSRAITRYMHQLLRCILTFFLVLNYRTLRENSLRIFDGVRVKSLEASILCAASILIATIAYPAETKKAPPQTCRRPNWGEVTVQSASGQCAYVGQGVYSTTSAIGLKDESIDSLEIGSFTEAVVCGFDKFFKVQCKQPIKSFHAKLSGESFGIRWTFLQVASSLPELICRPKDTEVTISAPDTHPTGIGPCIRRGPGMYKTAEEMGLAGVSIKSLSNKQEEKLFQQFRQKGTLLHKEVESAVQTGSKVQARICEGDNFAGTCMDQAQDKGFKRRPFGSMKVWNVCVPRDDQVALFAEKNGSGPCTILAAGEYLTEESVTIQGDATRSMWIGSAMEVRVCTEANLEGECEDITGKRNATSTVKSLKVRLR